MASDPKTRSFTPTPEDSLHAVPLLIGLMGPPGGGKTKSALRLADGMRRVRGGKPVVIDTEAGRSLKYRLGSRNPNGHEFVHFDFKAPFTPSAFLDAIKEALKLDPCCIIVDSASDEHEGEGGVLDWHDQMVPTMGGNEWAAWAKPKASRRVLLSGIQQVKVPLIFCFRAREKTVQQEVERNGRKRMEPVNVGFQPVAPFEFVHVLDLTCLLPARSDGVAVWSSPKGAEDFVIKLPEFLQPFVRKGAAIDEQMGEQLARWALGDVVKPPGKPAQPDFDVEGFIATVETKAASATDPDALKAWWESEGIVADRKRLAAVDQEKSASVRSVIADRIGILTVGGEV
jgi:hypothetical protein